MLLTVDMGNTDIALGFFDNEELKITLHTLTDTKKTQDEYLSLFKMLFREADISYQKVSGGIIASVVPSLTERIKSALESVFSFTFLLVAPPIKTGLSIRIDNPLELGGDLVADAVGTKEKFGFPSIMIDLGTATKVIVIDQEGSFIGGVFTPGLKVSVQALVGSTALLPDISLKRPKKIVGRNTSDSMNSGAIYGCAAMIRGLVDDIEKELGYNCHRVLMGGYAYLVKDLLSSDYSFAPDTVLNGLRIIFERNVNEGEKNHAQ